MPERAATPLLALENVSKGFGGLRAVDAVSFTVREHTITGLIGPNGAGKTTLFNILAGMHRPDAGRIRFRGEALDGLPPHRVFRKGLARTFQIPRPFPEMSVLENLLVAPSLQSGERFWLNWFARKRVRAEEATLHAKAIEVLRFLKLERLRDELAKNLSGGQQKLLEIGRALIAEPRMILLDEPGAGVNPTLLAEIVERIRELHTRGVTFLLIEHNMDLVMQLCDPILVMANGALLMQGSAREVQSDSRVLDAYLGGTP